MRYVESFKIVMMSVVAAIAYGIWHAQIAGYFCYGYYEYLILPGFSPPAIYPTLLVTWGVISSWWVGLILGVMLAITAQAGPWPTWPAKACVIPIIIIIAFTAVSAILSGTVAYCLEAQGYTDQYHLIPHPMLMSGYIPEYVGVDYSIDAAYYIGGLSGLVIVANVIRMRYRASRKHF